MKQQIKVGVIIPAAGLGKRMKSDVCKQYIEIDGKPILAFTLEKFQQSDAIQDIILVVGEDEIGYAEKYIKNRYGISKISNIIVGGKERQNSVYEGLKVLDKSIEIVLIHDAVRPMITVLEIEKVIEEAIKYKACVLGVRVKDTIKIVDEWGNVTSTPDRKKLYAIQTPQAFEKNLILEAYSKGMKDGFQATDDAMLVEQYTQVKVRVVEGSYANIKITTLEDFQIIKESLGSK